MSEHEHPAQIAHLAEAYTRLKEELRQVEERVDHAHRAYQVAAISFRDLAAHEDHLTLQNGAAAAIGDSVQHLNNLLNAHQLVQLLHERSRLRYEHDQVRDKLRSWLNYI